jgi:60S ribosome subunit biogenesis protein NIP7
VGVIIYNLNEMPLVSAAMIRSDNLCAAQGFGVTARSAADCRRAEATTLVALHQADVGEYIRAEDTLI